MAATLESIKAEIYNSPYFLTHTENDKSRLVRNVYKIAQSIYNNDECYEDVIGTSIIDSLKYYQIGKSTFLTYFDTVIKHNLAKLKADLKSNGLRGLKTQKARNFRRAKRIVERLNHTTISRKI